MKKYYVLFASVLLFLPCAANAQDINYVKAARALGWDTQLKAVETIFISLIFQSENNEKLGLSEDDLYDYVMLKCKNNFGDVACAPQVETTGPNASQFTKSFLETMLSSKEEIGLLDFKVWTVGDDYPVAYYVSYDFGTVDKESMKSDAVLGYGSYRNVESVIEGTLTEFVEDAAIYYFKVTGQL